MYFLKSKSDAIHATERFLADSAPYAKLTGTAERLWRTFYEMGRCMLLDSNQPDKLWNFAVQTAAYVMNWCYSNRTKKTQYEMQTGKKPNMSKHHKFRSRCFAYNTQEKGKLDSRCIQDLFIGNDKNSLSCVLC